MSADLLWFNGVDADDLGFTLSDAPDLLAEGVRAPQTLDRPQGVGAFLFDEPDEAPEDRRAVLEQLGFLRDGRPIRAFLR